MPIFFSPIVLCFAIGIFISNLTPLQIHAGIVESARDYSIILALPMILITIDARAWLGQSRATLFSFGSILLSGFIAGIIGALLLQQHIDAISIPAGMIVGIHSGGTPNLFAVGYAIEAPDDVITLTNSAQIFWGGILLLWLLSLAPVQLKGILRTSQSTMLEDIDDPALVGLSGRRMDVVKALLVCGVIILAGLMGSHLIYDTLQPTFLIIVVSTLAISCSFVSAIRSLSVAYDIGDYLLLTFGVAVGLLSDFRTLWLEGGQYIGFVGVTLGITLIIHLALSYLMRIDRDTFIITTVSAIYGPVFIPQVASVLANRNVIVPGIACSLAGLALGTYLGIGAYWLLHSWILI